MSQSFPNPSRALKNHNNLIYQFVIIILMQAKHHTEQSRHQPSLKQTIDLSPEREQWALINRYKALQFQRMKARQRMIDREKKQSFRRELDQQLNRKNNSEMKEKELDRNYYQKLAEEAETQRQREIEMRQEKIFKRKTIEYQNKQKTEAGRRSRFTDQDSGYHLDIGIQSQKERKQKSQMFRKEMMDTLDIQVREKTQEMKKNKSITRQMEELHQKVQDGYFVKPNQRKLYNQNQNVYDYYNRIQQQRQIKEKFMEQKLVEEPMDRSFRAQVERERSEELKKQENKYLIKNSLNNQIIETNKKRLLQGQTNPQQVSYQFISNVFRPKEQTYDKQAYKRELQKQAEQQRQRRLKQNHMSEQQYRFNMNQLSKAVVGSYAQQNYLDRSLSAIGDSKKYQLDGLKADDGDKDAEVIKKKLDLIRGNASMNMIGGAYY